jgi:GntR family transcriptional regulator
MVAGKIPSTRVLKCETIPAEDVDVDVSHRLKIQPRDPLYYVERLRLANQTPVILERRYVVAQHCPQLTATDLQNSLYAIWIEKYQLDIIGADQLIRAVNIVGDDAELMQVDNGAAGLLVSSTGYLDGDLPLWWENTLYRGEAYEFRNRLGPIQMARPAAGALLDFEDK